MQDSIYSAMFGALSNEHRMNVIANNLANVNTTGYKKDVVAFKDTFLHFAHDYILDSKTNLQAKPLWPEPDLVAKVRLSDQRIDFTQGSMKHTGNPLDLAINGEGFFRVQAPDTGEVFYTRSGSFSRNQAGQVVNGQGYQLMGVGGPIQIPPNTTNLSIDQRGRFLVDGAIIGQADVVTVTDLTELEKIGGNLLRLRDGALGAQQPVEAGIPQVVEGQDFPSVPAAVSQGYLEASNVEVITEMVRMIDVQRSFEAYQKIMTGTQELDKKSTELSSRT